MYATWDFLKRHRRKVATSLAVAGSFYAAKRLLETDIVNEFVHDVRARIIGQSGALRAEEEAEEDACISEARRQFLFDAHQQSCNKTLQQTIVPQLRDLIETKFDTSGLLEELRSRPDLGAQQKVEIWEKLKIHSIAKLVSVIAIFPLATVVLKAQKSIISQQLGASLQPNRHQWDNSILHHGMQYLRSIFYSEDESANGNHQQANSSTAHQLFSRCLDYFLKEGVGLLLGLIEQFVQHVFKQVKLAEQLGARDLHFLLERVRTRMRAVCGETNFADFVVPTTEVELAPVSGEGGSSCFRGLLGHFSAIIQSHKCRELVDAFNDQYFDAILQSVDETLPDGKTLPLAKIIPPLNACFTTLASTQHDSAFHLMLIAPELHQFTQFVASCVEPGDLVGLQ